MLLLSFLNSLFNNSIDSREEVNEQEKEWYQKIIEILDKEK